MDIDEVRFLLFESDGPLCYRELHSVAYRVKEETDEAVFEGVDFGRASDYVYSDTIDTALSWLEEAKWQSDDADGEPWYNLITGHNQKKARGFREGLSAEVVEEVEDVYDALDQGDDVAPDEAFIEETFEMYEAHPEDEDGASTRDTEEPPRPTPND